MHNLAVSAPGVPIRPADSTDPSCTDSIAPTTSIPGGIDPAGGVPRVMTGGQQAAQVGSEPAERATPHDQRLRPLIGAARAGQRR